MQSTAYRPGDDNNTRSLILIRKNTHCQELCNSIPRTMDGSDEHTRVRPLWNYWSTKPVEAKDAALRGVCRSHIQFSKIIHSAILSHPARSAFLWLRNDQIVIRQRQFQQRMFTMPECNYTSLERNIKHESINRTRFGYWFSLAQ